MSRADDERLEGYLDGYKPDSPEPSANRSHSYRHGFICGRADLDNVCSFPSVADALAASALAEQKDVNPLPTRVGGDG